MVKPVVCRDKDHEHNKRSQGMINVLTNIDCVPSNVQFSHHEALLYVFEDNEAVIKMIFKGRSPTMRHVSRTHRVALDWLSDRINLDPQIQIKYIETKNQLADMLTTKGNFTVTNGIIFCVCLTSAISVLQIVLKWCQKERKKNQVKKRITAKSRPMMSLIARAPSTLSSSASESPEKRSYEGQSPLSMQAEKYDRTGNPLFAVTQVTSKATTTDLLKVRTQQATQNGTMIKHGLLKSGNLMNWWMIQRWNPFFCPRRGAHAFQSRPQ